jgi:hypothetical protein
MTAGTRTAGTVDGTGVYRLVSLRLIDESGDIRTMSVHTPSTTTNAEIESFAAAYQAVTQASLFSIHVTEVYSAVEDKNDAQTGTRDSVFDVLNILNRNASAVADTIQIHAPEPATMLDNSDEIDPASGTLGTLFTTMLAVLNGGAGGAGTYEVISARYTERKERNKAIKI